ncbi:hypothetical protein IWX46DRAFT_251666 [Phyllosticta citricarpa]|uniref:Uncharacterized protein n=1 Tax=Phyllosticta citricarpa TaxID=55181 RepID=A0ABR1LQX3_9PEZI
MHIMYNADISQIKIDFQQGRLVANTGIVKPNICVYETKSGLPVVPPTQNFHFPTSAITGLIGQKIPPASQPTGEDALPGCSTNAGMDCLIARAINGYPKECSGNPFTMKCVLFLAPAFCFDVPGRRLKQPRVAEAQVEFCLRNVACGPCCANAGGAACASGQFPGIAQWVSGGGRPSKRGLDQPEYGALVKRATNDPFFGDQPNNLPLLDQFYVGIMKNLINAAIDIWNLLRKGLVYSARMNCYALTVRLQGSTDELNKIREGCADTFQPHEPVKNLPLYGEIEEAGSIFADVVSILFAAADLAKVVQATKYIGKVGEIISKFAPRSYGKGKILEAKGPSGGTVQIFNDYGDGKPVTFFTDAAIKDVKETTEEFGFRNCHNCKGVVRRQGGSASKLLCCIPRSRREAQLEYPLEPTPAEEVKIRESYGAMLRIEEPIPAAQRSIGKTIPITRDGQALKVLEEGSSQYRSYYLDERPPPPMLDPVNQVFYQKIGELYAEAARNPSKLTPWKQELFNAMVHTWGATADDVVAIQSWVALEQVIPELEVALRKLNPVRGWTISTQHCPEELVEILRAGAPGPSSKGPPGVYSIRDITTYFVSETYEEDPIGLGTSLGMFPVWDTSTTPYRFCILSESGRYIPPFDGTMYHEVLFHENLAGKFKLLGYEEVNGGEAAKAAGGPPPFGVFYFQEVEVPPFTPHQVQPPVINFP